MIVTDPRSAPGGVPAPHGAPRHSTAPHTTAAAQLETTP